MSDGDSDAEEGRSLPRRIFLKLGTTGAAGWGWLDEVSVARGRPQRGSRSQTRDGDASGPATPRAVPKVDFLPPTAAELSVRGLDASDSFALSSVATDHEVDRRPLSVRELVTPQNVRRLTDADKYSQLDQTDNGRIVEAIEWLAGKIQGKITWQNWLQDPDHRTQGTVVGVELSSYEKTDVDPGDRQRRDLIGTVVETATGKFRGVGSGHSHSEAAMPRDGFNDLKNVDGEIGQPDRWIKNSPPAYHATKTQKTIDPKHLVRVGAGTTVKELNRAILPKKGGGLALPNMGSWDGQTLAGAINTSTHGTGLELGSLADLVRSVEIVVVPKARTAKEPHVRMLRVEPDEGITDPTAFARDAHSHDTTLVQDDELFHSVVVGYGSMGIVYAYTLECRDAFWLREETAFRRWNAINAVAEAKNARHYKVNINLAAKNRTNPRCQVKRWTEVSANGRSPTERTTTLQTIDQFIESLPAKLLQRIRKAGGVQNAPLRTVVPTSPPWSARNANAAPFRGGRFETASYIALRRRYARRPNQPEQPPEQPPDVITTEINVPLSKTDRAVQAVLDHVSKHRRWFPVPLSIRFAAGSRHYLSPEYGHDKGTAVLEFLLPVLEEIREAELGEAYTDPDMIAAQKAKAFLKANGQQHLTDIREAKRELEQVEDILVGQFDGRPHLGKHNTVDTGSNRSYMRPRNMFPKYDSWLAAHKYVNQYGTFDAKFTDRKVR